MPEQFLHGVEVVEIDSGPRPISTVRASVIGIVGTAPAAAAATPATLRTGYLGLENALVWTAVAPAYAGAAGNAITVALTVPAGANQALAVTVTGTAISVALATGATAGVATSTAAQVLAAVNAHVTAHTLVTVSHAAGSDGTGVAAASPAQALSGGVNEPFPLDTPVLVTNRSEAARLGTTGTLPAALDGIYDQTGAVVVVVRVAVGVDDAATRTNVIGGVSVGGAYTGLHALRAAEAAVGVTPRILIAPGFTQTTAVLTELLGIAGQLRAVIIADGPNTTDAAAIQYRQQWGSPRVYLIDPWVRVWDTATSTERVEPCSARAAGVMARVDNERGFWWSPSNNEIFGILGPARPVDFQLGDTSSRANLLNEAAVATIVQQQGFRLWGNRTCSSDPKWAFVSVRRTADMINESLLRAHLWAVDRNITRTYVEDVIEGVRAYLRHLRAVGAILGGDCWADPQLNTPDQISQGKVYFDFDFSAAYPAEHITFRSHLVNDYLTEVFADAA